MAMGFFVAAHRELRDMRAHYVAGQLEVYIPAAGATLFPLIQWDIAHVGHEVDFQLAAPKFSFAAEILLFLGRKTVGESKVIAEDEIQVVKQVHHKRRVGDGKIPGRDVPLAVEVLVVRVERNRKQTPRMPFKSVLPAVSLPDGSCSMSFEYVDHLLVHMLLLS